VALWTLVILARPLVAWKLALIGTMVAVAVLVLAVPALSSGVLLMEVTPRVLLIALPVGVTGAVLVEVAERIASAAADRRPARTDRTGRGRGGLSPC
jgi:cation-transporting ATPase E